MDDIKFCREHRCLYVADKCPKCNEEKVMLESVMKEADRIKKLMPVQLKPNRASRRKNR